MDGAGGFDNVFWLAWQSQFILPTSGSPGTLQVRGLLRARGSGALAADSLKDIMI
jgi:hypothetical protein